MTENAENQNTFLRAPSNIVNEALQETPIEISLLLLLLVFLIFPAFEKETRFYVQKWFVMQI